jgi:hypothetical protein
MRQMMFRMIWIANIRIIVSIIIIIIIIIMIGSHTGTSATFP